MKLYEKLADNTARYLCEDTESDRYEKIKYGAQAFYIGIAKTLLAFFLTIVLFPELLPALLVFIVASAFLSSSSFGAHMPNTLLCTLEGLVKYLGGSYLATHVLFPWWVSALCLLISAIVFYLYAPAATKKRPIPKNQVGPFKSRSLFKLLILVLLTSLPPLPFAPWVGNILILAAISQSIFLLPFWNPPKEAKKENEHII